MQNGIRISLEGLDGTGKTTLATWLTAVIQERGISALHTREPGGTAIAEELRAMLLSREGICATMQALLMSASRVELYRDVIMPAILRGDVVVAERNELSTLTYQFPNIPADYEYAVDLTRYVREKTGMAYRPGITLYMQADPEQLLDQGRIHTPDAITGIDHDVIRTRLHQRHNAYEQWIDILRTTPPVGWQNETVITIDALQDLDAVKDAILNAVLSRITPIT